MNVRVLLLGVAYSTLFYASQATYYSNTQETSQCNNCCQGLPGPQGVPGLPGLHGTRGQDGHQGIKGHEGNKGEKGFQGLQGQTGPVGPKGFRGKRGQKGECGPHGTDGNKGELGSRGYPGNKGSKGEIGAKGGRPPKIAFSVSRTEKLGPVIQKTTVIFDRIHINMGDNFDIYSSHFVCKTNGTYLFTTHILGQNTVDAYAWIMLNNEHQIALHGDGRAGYGTGSNTIILHLVYDDHVWVELGENSALMNFYSSYSGHLLFED